MVRVRLRIPYTDRRTALVELDNMPSESTIEDLSAALDGNVKIAWPPICACCGRPSTTAIEVRSPSESAGWDGGMERITYRTAKVPYCAACKAHIDLSQARANRAEGFGCLGIGALIILMFWFVATVDSGSGRTAGIVMSIIGICLWSGALVLILMRSHGPVSMSPSCATVGPAVKFVHFLLPTPQSKSHCFVTFEFANRRYASQFKAMNYSNSDEISSIEAALALSQLANNKSGHKSGAPY